MKLIADEMAETIEIQAEEFISKQAARDVAVLDLSRAISSFGKARKEELAIMIMHLSRAGVGLEDLYVSDEVVGKIPDLFPGRPIGSKWAAFSVGGRELKWDIFEILVANRINTEIIRAMYELADMSWPILKNLRGDAMAISLKTSFHIGTFSDLARVAFMVAQNSRREKRLNLLEIMVEALNTASMFGEGEVGCAEIGISVEEVQSLRCRAEREIFRKDPSKWDPRVAKKETTEEN